MDFQALYQSKLTTAAEAAKLPSPNDFPNNDVVVSLIRNFLWFPSGIV